MSTDPHAPLIAREEVLINAPLDKVWALETDIDRWPDWQPEVSVARLEGPLAVGTVFAWKAKGLRIVSTIREYEPETRISWTGRALGMNAIHIWAFEPYDGGTRVTVEESLSGWFPRMMKIFNPAFLEKSMRQSLQVLKSRAEQV